MMQLMRSTCVRSAAIARSAAHRPGSISLSAKQYQQRGSMVTNAASDSYEQVASRSFAQYNVYKGKGAMSMKPIPPTWEATTSQRGNALQNVKRPGVLLFEFANALPNQGSQSGFGNRNYDWQNKIVISLNVTELAQLSDLPPMGSMAVFHDPDKNTPQEGSRGKKLNIAPITNQDGSMFFSISGKNASGSNQSVTVPVTPTELKVIRLCAEFLIPRLMGFDELLLSSGQQAPMQ